MSGEKQAEIRQAIARIEANIERARIQKSWRILDESTVEEHIEIWLRHDIEEGGELKSDSTSS